MEVSAWRPPYGSTSRAPRHACWSTVVRPPAGVPPVRINPDATPLVAFAGSPRSCVMNDDLGSRSDAVPGDVTAGEVAGAPEPPPRRRFLAYLIAAPVLVMGVKLG